MGCALPSASTTISCVRSTSSLRCRRWGATALSILGHGACVRRVPRGRPADSHRSDRARFARLEWVRAPRLTFFCVAPRMRPAGRESGERHGRVGGRSGDCGADTGRHGNWDRGADPAEIRRTTGAVAGSGMSRKPSASIWPCASVRPLGMGSLRYPYGSPPADSPRSTRPRKPRFVSPDSLTRYSSAMTPSTFAPTLKRSSPVLASYPVRRWARSRFRIQPRSSESRASREKSQKSNTSHSAIRLNKASRPGRLCLDAPEIPASTMTSRSLTTHPLSSANKRQRRIWSAGESADCLSVLMRA